MTEKQKIHRYKIEDTGWMQHIVPTTQDDTCETFLNFAGAKAALKQSFQRTIKDYRWALQTLNKTKVSDVHTNTPIDTN